MLSTRQKSIVWMGGWCFSYVALTLFMKCMGGAPLPFVLFIKNALGLLYCLPLLFFQRPSCPSARAGGWYLLRSFIVYGAMWCTYASYRELPLSTATAVGFTEPMLGALLAAVLLKVRIAPFSWMLMLVGYVGVLVMNYPITLSGSRYLLVALLANLLAALARLITRVLTRSQTAAQISFYGGVVGVLVSFARALPYLSTPISCRLCAYIVAVSLCSFASQYCYTSALALEGLEKVAPLTYTRLVLSVPAAYYFFGEVPTVFALLGSLLILVANYWLLTRSE